MPNEAGPRPHLNASVRSTCAERRAGSVPKRRAVTSEIIKVNARRRTSGAMLSGSGRGERNPCVVNVALAMERNDRPGEIPPDRFGKNIDAGLGLRNGYPWFQPSEDVKRVPPLIFEAVPAGRDLLFHRERNPNIGSLAHCGAKEFGRTHATDGIDRCADGDG